MSIQYTVIRIDSSKDLARIQPRPCPDCGDKITLTVPVSAIQAYENGAFIQQAFPMLSASDRERLMSGMCSKCWDKMFPLEEDDPMEDF